MSIDEGRTPAETPSAKYRVDEPEAELSEELPELAPLSREPTAIEVAWRYGADSAFLRRQWPALVRAIRGLQESVEEIGRIHRRSAAWPFIAVVLSNAVTALAVVLYFVLHR